jgi:hypothetical protein
MLHRTVALLALSVMTMMAWGARAATAEEFYTLASVQTATLDRGQVVLKLTANGPVAYRLVDDESTSGVPSGAQGGIPTALHLRLYGVRASAIGAAVTTDVGRVALAPDGHGNLNVTLQPAGAFAGHLLRVASGRTANEIEIRLAPEATP